MKQLEFTLIFEDFAKGLMAVSQLPDGLISWSSCCAVAQAAFRDGCTYALVEDSSLTSEFRLPDGRYVHCQATEDEEYPIGVFDYLANMVLRGELYPEDHEAIQDQLNEQDLELPATVSFYEKEA